MFDKRDIHVHVPEGATPKDGPSAGIGMATVIVSMLTGIPVRRDIAMTGEITLRGRVLPIGGLKEKLLAALRGGIKKVLIPEDNVKDLAEIPNSVKNGLEIVPVSRMEEVLAHALVRRPTPIVWEERRGCAAAFGLGRRGRQRSDRALTADCRGAETTSLRLPGQPRYVSARILRNSRLFCVGRVLALFFSVGPANACVPSMKRRAMGRTLLSICLGRR